jgi:hypothetical protein
VVSLNEKLIFCFPYRGAGGVNMMFMRLASYLADRGLDAALIDYEDGDMAINKRSDVELIPYYDDQTVFVPENAVLILQSLTPWSLYASLDIPKTTRLFFITTLPANFYPVLPGRFRNAMLQGGKVASFFWFTLLTNEYKKAKNFLHLIERKDANVFLDGDIVCNLSRSFNIDLTENTVMPLFSDAVSSNVFVKSRKHNHMVLGWLGRIADFKINILNKVMKDAFSYADTYRELLEFHVIGDGEYVSELFDLQSDYFKVVKIPYVKPSELNTALMQCDILFAMGTSALESAKLGTPTVRLDYSYDVIPEEYRYKFFHEIENYSMGDNIESACFKNGSHTFEDICQYYLQNRVALSEQVFEHYEKHHSIERATAILLNKLKSSQLYWSEMLESKLLSSFWYSCWNSVRKILNKIV